ncbi:FecR family protein [Emcibacter sp.]|uniref:FecR family protein n=1 Tax=Emcibacter sp. TaxID=1979954 RepID=UPI002AA8D954|nr:FecR domain-containing protein [Emcibacter sp.]
MGYEIKRENINDAAAHWALKSGFEELSEADQIAFEEWLAQSMEHVQAFEQACQVMGDLRALKDMPEAMLIQDTADHKITFGWFSHIRNWIGDHAKPLSIGSAVAAALLLYIMVQFAWFNPGRTYNTEVAEIREILLDDGSHITLGAKSEINVDYSTKKRSVTLVKGRAFFAVEKDPDRPFYVMAAKSIVKVVGTKFDVHLGKQRKQISVLEGLVSVTPNNGLARHETQDIAAGELLTVSDNLVKKTKPAQEPGEWRAGQFIYEAAPLGEIISDANRYYRGQIILDGAGLEDLKVTTSFSVKQIDQMVETLTHILPLEAEYNSDGRVVLRTKG